jgi:hypothetical protein
MNGHIITITNATTANSTALMIGFMGRLRFGINGAHSVAVDVSQVP